MKQMMKTLLCILWVVMMANQDVAAQPTSAPETIPNYRIGYFYTPPLSFKDPQGQPTGLAIDLMNEVARQHQFEIEWVYGDFPELITMMKAQTLDALTSVGYSAERAEFMDYSRLNFSNVWGQVFLPSNSRVENLFDLEGLSIALMENDVNGINFINQCEQFEVNCLFTYGKSYPEVFQMLVAGQADAAVSNNLVGFEFQQDLDILPSSIVFNPFKVFITVPRGRHGQILRQYDQTMFDWKQNRDSFYYQARIKWSEGPVDQAIPAWLWYSILGLLLFAVVAMMAAVLFKKQVKRRVDELSQREVQLNQIINIVPHMIYANDHQGRIILADNNACQFFGINDDEVEQQNIHTILASSDNYSNLLSYMTSTNPFNTEIKARDHQDKKFNLLMSKVPYSGRNQAEPAVVTVGVDITQAKAYEKEIKYLAHFDPLTGLPNRLLLKDRLKSSLARAMQFNHVGGILHLDLDNFKNINDSQGHKVGDKLIKKVAARIQSCVTAGDTIARLGGDEFVIELPELNNAIQTAEEQAVELAKKIIKKLKQPIEIEKKHYHITASVGLVIYPRDGENQATLLQRADTAMYEAKTKGKNRIQIFEKGLESQVKKNHQLENDLRQALKNKEIKMAFQPIVDAASLEVVGSEVLLRWQHPTEGVIMPTDFIPIAERSQMILNIGYWTIEQACQQIIKWKSSASNPFFLAVNLSVIQIRDQQFLERVTNLINQYNIPKNYLEFEVTESILMNESQRSIEIIKQLKLLGIKLSIDDFGTGYSSFDYIRKLPLDKIKIDKSFIKDIPGDNNSTTIVKAILNMAKEMQLEVVAEGVEQAEQIEFLLQHHCQYLQGYYFSKPRSEAQLQSNFSF